MPLVQPARGQGPNSQELLLPDRPPPRLTCRLCFAALGFLFILLVLRSRIARRGRGRRSRGRGRTRGQDTRHGTLPIFTSIVSTAVNQQRLWPSEKSRGVGNYTVMSANHPPEQPQLGLGGYSPYPVQDITGKDQSGGLLGDGDEAWEDGVAPFTRHETERRGGRRDQMARPPPPPPLTPPTPAQCGFPFEERRLGAPVSAVGGDLKSFFEQPNPDYAYYDYSPGYSSSTTAIDTRQTSPATHRRKSYTRVLPISDGSPETLPGMDGNKATQGYDRVLSSPSSSSVVFPSSFPSSSPALPLAPHASFAEPVAVSVSRQPNEIDVQGEIISVTDDSGAGWKRHTRVYGGSVCLACMEFGRQHGAEGGDGGFYGENVRPEDRR